MSQISAIMPTNLRQMFVSAAYILMAAIAAIAVTALITQSAPANAANAVTVQAHQETTTDNDSTDMLVKFTSMRTGRERVVTIPAVSLHEMGQAADSFTVEDLIAGMRVLCRFQRHNLVCALPADQNGTMEFWILKNELNQALHRYTKWSAEEESRLRDVLALYYPGIHIND